MEIRSPGSVPVKKQDIYFGVTKVGTLDVAEEYGRFSCHAVLNVNAFSPCSYGLAQGFGDTPAAAVEDAFISSRKSSRRYLCCLDKLEEMFRISEANSKPVKTVEG